MARRDGTSSRYARGRTHDYDTPDHGYARRRRSPSRSPSRASRAYDHSDRRRPRALDSENRSLGDSTDDDDTTSSDDDAPSRSASRGRAASIRSVQSPRAALHRFHANIRRSPVPASPDRSSRAYTPPAGRPPLPPGWTPQFSTRHGRRYYHNQATGHSQWEAPGFEKTLRGILLNKADGGGRIGVDGGGGTDDHEGNGASRGRGRLRGGMGGGSGGSHKYAEPHRKHGHGGLGTAGLLLSVAGGIAAGTLLARALQSKSSRRSTSASTVRRRTSWSSFAD